MLPISIIVPILVLLLLVVGNVVKVIRLVQPVKMKHNVLCSIRLHRINIGMLVKDMGL